MIYTQTCVNNGILYIESHATTPQNSPKQVL